MRSAGRPERLQLGGVLQEVDVLQEGLVPVLGAALVGERAAPVEGGVGEVGKLAADNVVELLGSLIDVQLGLQLAAGVGSALLIDTVTHDRRGYSGKPERLSPGENHAAQKPLPPTGWCAPGAVLAG